MYPKNFLGYNKSLFILFFSLTYIYCTAQSTASCSLANPLISAQGNTTFCMGDSVILVATDSGSLAKVLDQSQLIYTGGTSARTLTGYSEWQSFTAGLTGTLSEIDMGFFNYINGAGTLNIFSGQGTGGSLLQSQPVNVSCPSGNCMVPFAVNVAVTAAQVYTFQFIPGTGMPDPYGVQVSMSNTYAGGEMGLVDPSGTSYPGFDIVFKTFVSTPVALTYQWSNGTSGPRTTVYTTNTYTVTVSDTSRCSASASINVNAYPLPVAYLHDTSIQRHKPIKPYTMGTGLHYLWSNGDTTSQIVIDTAGTVTVKVTDAHGCFVIDTSVVSILNTGIDDAPMLPNTIKVYPNPIADHITIEVNSMVSEYSISLYDLLGRRLLVTEGLKVKTEITTASLYKGEYILEVSANGHVYRYRLSK